MLVSKTWNIFKILLSSLGNISLMGEEKKDNSLFSDEEIIKRIKKWEKELFEELLKRYQDKMFRYAYYQFNFSKQKAEEIVQDIFLKVWNNLEKFDDKTNFNAWIYRLAHNLILDSFKKKELNLVESDIQDLRLYKEFDENKHYLIEELLKKIWEKYREIIILYYFEWKSYDEIAEIYNTSKNTVWSWIKRTKDKLKEIVEQDKKLKEALILDL